MLQYKRRLCALLVSLALLLPQLPITARAESAPPPEGQIISFEALPAQVATQTVAEGTGLEALHLPAALAATVYPEATVQIPVADWDSAPPYDGAAGTYVFTPSWRDKPWLPAWSFPPSP